MSESWHSFLEQSKRKVADAKRTRQRRPLDLAGLIDFGSNDYLGLRGHPEVLAALHRATKQSSHSQTCQRQTSQLQSSPDAQPSPTPPVRWGAGASPVLSGYTTHHALLEESLAAFSATDAALVFSSGFGCHSGSVACLAGSEDLILSDRLNHASLIDGCRLSRATTVIYPHGDAGFVRQYLQQHRHQFAKVLLLSESIFSMDGDAAPLVDLVELAQRYDAGLVVDEAHAVGVYGPRGGGLLEELDLQSHVLAKLGTLSKALGGVGGYVAGDQDLIAYLVNHCRSYLFSTASPGPSLVAAHRALQLLVDMPDQRQSLRQRSTELRQQLRRIGLDVPEGNSPIVPVIIGTEARALELGGQLWERGVYVPAIRPPTVPDGTCRLRISLSTSHTTEQIERLVSALKEC